MLLAQPRTALRILFVDDELNVLNGLRRSMHSMRSEWAMSFASSGTEALSMMVLAPPDVVISDMRMPGMNGGDLLLEVKRLYPKIVRFVLSGYAESASIMQVAGVAHQYLAKPCESEDLKSALGRAFSLRRLLDDDGLLRQIGRIDALPSLPAVYQEIVACLKAPDPAVADVARIISRDVSMVAVVLKLANSAFFGAKQTFRTADRAVSFLGLNTIAGVVLAHSIFKEFAISDESGFSLEQLWSHSLRTAANARSLAQAENWSAERIEEAFLAGVLHDLGKVILAVRAVELGEDSGHIGKNPKAPDSVKWDAHHAAVGAYLLGLWGFSDVLVEAIALHHTPSKAAGGGFGLAGLLHVADRLAQDDVPSGGMLGSIDIECGYLESLGLSDRLPVWQAACGRNSTIH